MADFGALPPEVNSARMYAGPGSGPLLAAAAAWQGLAEELSWTATSYHSVIAELTGGPWLGPASVAMAAAGATYVTWLQATATQCEETAAQARAAASAYEAAHSMTVPPPVIAANRAQLAMLVATNFLGQNTPAIAATEAQYGAMWAQDAAAMYGYAGAAAAATVLSPFTPPQQTTDQHGLADQAGAVGQAATTPAGGTHAEVTQASGSISKLLETLGSPLQETVTESSEEALWEIRDLLPDDLGGAEGVMAGGNTLIPGVLADVPAASVTSAVPAGAASTVSATMGEAESVGALRIPPTWASAAGSAGAPGAALAGTTVTAAPVASTPTAGMLPPVAGLGRARNAEPAAVAPRYGRQLVVTA